MSTPVTYEDLQHSLRQRGWELAEMRGGYAATTTGSSVFLGDLEQVEAWFTALADSRQQIPRCYMFDSDQGK